MKKPYSDVYLNASIIRCSSCNVRMENCGSRLKRVQCLNSICGQYRTSFNHSEVK